MPRALEPELDAALQSGHFQPLLAVALHAPSGVLRLFAGMGQIPFGGHVYSGTELGRIARLSEQTAARRQGIEVGLVGVRPEVLDIMDQERLEDSLVEMFFGAVNDNMQVVGTPVLIRRDRVDVPQSVEGADSLSVTLSTYGAAHDINRQPDLFWDDESFQARHPGDTFFARLKDLQDKNVEVERQD
ncbi:MAG: hypothetical protein MI920_01975 [Kiloniellales bacterium]|nr:hypothetical protein [Kiloniellales bacterium]